VNRGEAVVLQVDPAEGRHDGEADRDDLFGVPGGESEGKSVGLGELLEEHGFVLHDRQGGLGTDVPQAENGGPVAHDRDRPKAMEDPERDRAE